VRSLLAAKVRTFALLAVLSLCIVVAILHFEYRLILLALLPWTVVFVAALDFAATRRDLWRDGGEARWDDTKLVVAGACETLCVPFARILDVYVGAGFARFRFDRAEGRRSVVLATKDSEAAASLFRSAGVTVREEPHVVVLLGMFSGVALTLVLGVLIPALVAGALGQFFAAGGSALLGVLMLIGATVVITMLVLVKAWVAAQGK